MIIIYLYIYIPYYYHSIILLYICTAFFIDCNEKLVIISSGVRRAVLRHNENKKSK